MFRGNFKLTPEEFEREVQSKLLDEAGNLTEFTTQRRHILSADDGTYEIDIVARFKALGVDFLILVECKRYSSPVERQIVQVLYDKVRATGAHMGMLFATSGFQKGAVYYARKHGIKLVQLADGRAQYFSDAVPEHLRLPSIAMVITCDEAETEEAAVVRGSSRRGALLEGLGIATPTTHDVTEAKNR